MSEQRNPFLEEGAEMDEGAERYWAAIARGMFRAQELGWCMKDDDCHVQARGALLAMNDIGEALKDLEPALSNRARGVLTSLLVDPDERLASQDTPS